jgi:hypothetical protein
VGGPVGVRTLALSRERLLRFYGDSVRHALLDSPENHAATEFGPQVGRSAWPSSAALPDLPLKP